MRPVIGVLFRKRRFGAELTAKLRAFATVLTRDPDLAEDLTQDTFLKLLEREDLPDEPQSMRRYAFTTLRNLYIDTVRKKRVRREYYVEQERLGSERTASGFDSVEQIIVREAFAQLSCEHREILFLVDVMGFKYDEAADTLGVAKGTVMSRVSRARAQMIKQLEDSPVQKLEPKRTRAH